MNRIKIYAVAFLSLMTTAAYSQIEISSDAEPADTLSKKKKRPSIDKSQSNTEFFAITNWSSTSRKLIENPSNQGVFAQPLGERANETSLNTWSFGIGIKQRVHEFVTWEGGISFLKNGENYLYETSDTTHSYTTTYSYISMPVKVYFTYGNNIRLYAGVGLVPQMFLKYKQDRAWKNAVNTETDESFSTQNGYRSAVLSAVANVGVQINMGKSMSLLVMPEYRFQLTSTNINESPYSHFGRALGVNIGLSYLL